MYFCCLKSSILAHLRLNQTCYLYLYHILIKKQIQNMKSRSLQRWSVLNSGHRFDGCGDQRLREGRPVAALPATPQADQTAEVGTGWLGAGIIYGEIRNPWWCGLYNCFIMFYIDFVKFLYFVSIRLWLIVWGGESLFGDGFKPPTRLFAR